MFLFLFWGWGYVFVVSLIVWFISWLVGLRRSWYWLAWNSLCSPDCPAFPVLGVKVCAPTPGKYVDSSFFQNSISSSPGWLQSVPEDILELLFVYLHLPKARITSVCDLGGLLFELISCEVTSENLGTYQVIGNTSYELLYHIRFYAKDIMQQLAPERPMMRLESRGHEPASPSSRTGRRRSAV